LKIQSLELGHVRQPDADRWPDLVVLQVKHGDPGVLVEVSNLAPPAVLEVHVVVYRWFDVATHLAVNDAVDHLVGHDREAVLIDGVLLEGRRRA